MRFIARCIKCGARTVFKVAGDPPNAVDGEHLDPPCHHDPITYLAEDLMPAPPFNEPHPPSVPRRSSFP